MQSLTSKKISEITKGELIGREDVLSDKVITDSRKASGGELFVALKGERFDGADYLESLEGKVGIAITSRKADVSYPQIVVEDTLDALTELSRYHAKSLKSDVITVALTGSVGKTTTKELTASVIAKKYATVKTEGNLNNHIGVPLTLLSVDDSTEALVLEMGMNHKGEIEHLAGLTDYDIAMVTCIGHSHIENLGSREGIRDAKLEIVKGLKKTGTLILSADEPLLQEVDFEGRIVRVGEGEGADVRLISLSALDDGVEFSASVFGKNENFKLSVAGRHNAMNSLFAIAVGYLLGISFDDIRKGLLEYTPVGLRQNVYEKNSVTVIADCYNASFESMIAALTLLSERETKGRRIAVLSDMLELGQESERLHKMVGEELEGLKVDLLFTTGTAARDIFLSKPERVGGAHLEDKKALSKELEKTLREGDTLLFKASRSMKLEEVIGLLGLEK